VCVRMCAYVCTCLCSCVCVCVCVWGVCTRPVFVQALLRFLGVEGGDVMMSGGRRSDEESED